MTEDAGKNSSSRPSALIGLVALKEASQPSRIAEPAAAAPDGPERRREEGAVEGTGDAGLWEQSRRDDPVRRDSELVQYSVRIERRLMRQLRMIALVEGGPASKIVADLIGRYVVENKHKIGF